MESIMSVDSNECCAVAGKGLVRRHVLSHVECESKS